MAKAISVEHSAYITEQMEIFSENRLGQYSKFLEQNYIPVKYYHTSEVHSLRDTGTGNVNDIIGKNSPFRFNKILDFPIYNMPELKPNIDFDPSTGFDVEMDISDILILPSTIKPRENDLILVELPKSVQLLFRVNNIRYNTIQSNDFYQVDCDIYKIGDPDKDQDKISIEELVDRQVVETYYTVFDNIGTDDKCFIKSDDLPKLKQVSAVILDLKNIYRENYYNRVVNAFVYDPYSTTCSGDNDAGYYDMYLAKFINETNIYYDPYGNHTIVLTNQNNLPSNFDKMFRRTLLNAVLSRSSKYIDPYIYYYTNDSTNRFSAFSVFNVGVHSPILVSNGKHMEPNLPQIQDGAMRSYYNCALLHDIKDGVLHECNDYTVYEKIIFDYIQGNTINIDHDEITDLALDDNLANYMTLPIIIFILMKSYDEYFRKMDDELTK